MKVHLKLVMFKHHKILLLLATIQTNSDALPDVLGQTTRVNNINFTHRQEEQDCLQTTGTENLCSPLRNYAISLHKHHYSINTLLAAHNQSPFNSSLTVLLEVTNTVGLLSTRPTNTSPYCCQGAATLIYPVLVAATAIKILIVQNLILIA